MQQTETYKLNLIETSDTFSPAPLNENMEKVEAAITANTTALDNRVTALEVHKIVSSTYTGTGSGWLSVHLGFTPAAVIAQPAGNVSYLAVPGGKSKYIDVEDGGFKVSEYLNNKGTIYNYFAIL